MAKPHTSRVSVAVLGGETLLGREMRELLRSADFAGPIQLFSTADEPAGVLTQEHGEAAVMPPLAASDLASTRLLFLAGAPEAGVQALKLARSQEKGPVLIDLTGGLEDNPAARLRAPELESPESKTSGPIQVIAHPAAIALALFLRRLHAGNAIKRSVVLIFEPVSERGQPGLDELQKQTVGLLSFKKLPQKVFDAQIGFNLLPQYGSEAPRSLEEIESKIDRHLASLLATAGNVPMPSLRLVQAPVFHGYSISAWVEFVEKPELNGLIGGLASANIEVRAGEEEAPSNVGAAGQSGITVGAIAADRNNPRAFWFWIVGDNLRIVAENAIEVAREAVG